ncbi:MAG: RlmE family RNA methyltransferase [Myxococcota bacterium]
MKKRISTSRGSRKGFVAQGASRYDRHDVYYRRAKEEGWLARSVYKLEELDRDFKLIRPGDNVLDLGSAPGSWLQFAERRVHERGGLLVGIDLLPVRLSFGPHVKVIQGDVFKAELHELLPPGLEVAEDAPAPRPFDVVMSDMAPNTTGIRSVDQARSMALAERALEVALRVLRPGGRYCVKVFEGGDFAAYLDALRAGFRTVKVRRPKGVRVGSIETYVVALDRKRDVEETP